VSLLLAVCGGDDAPSRETSRAKLTGSAGKRRRSSRSSANPRTAPEEIADAIDEVIEETRQAANELVDLARPEGAAADTSPSPAE
jgi:hypothetical protein